MLESLPLAVLSNQGQLIFVSAEQYAHLDEVEIDNAVLCFQSDAASRAHELTSSGMLSSTYLS